MELTFASENRRLGLNQTNSFSRDQSTLFFMKKCHPIIPILHSDYSNKLTIQIDFCLPKLFQSIDSNSDKVH